MKAKLIKRSENYYELHEVRPDRTILIGSSDPERKLYVYGKNEHKLLSLKNCQAIECGYDLDELKDEFISNQLNGLDKESQEKYYSFAEDDANSFIKGFQKCLEILGDKKVFISKDTYEHYLHQQKLQDGNSKNPLSEKVEELKNIAFHGNYLFNNLMEELTKSIQQQTEFDVEIEMCVSENYVETDIIKLDSEGCLILKRI